MKRKEITDGTWVYSEYYKQANLIKEVNGDVVTFRYPFKAANGEIYHTSLSYMTQKGAYRMPTLQEMEAVNKGLGIETQKKSNNFKEGDFYFDYASGLVNQIKKISAPIHFGDAGVELTYTDPKNGSKSGMLSYFNNPNYCRPATEMEVYTFIHNINKEIKPDIEYHAGEWVVFKFSGFEDVNRIRSMNTATKEVRVVHPILSNKGSLTSTYTAFENIVIYDADIVRHATTAEIAKKFERLFAIYPDQMVSRYKNLK